MRKVLSVFLFALALAFSVTGTTAERKVIGKWGFRGPWPDYPEFVYTIYVENGKTYLHIKLIEGSSKGLPEGSSKGLPEGSSTSFRIVQDTRGMGSIVYRAPRDPEGDYWVIRHGNLEIWNAMGRIGTLHPVKRGDQHRREKQPKPIEPKKELGL